MAALPPREVVPAVQAPSPNPVKPDPEQSIERGELKTAGTPATQDRQLVAERDDF